MSDRIIPSAPPRRDAGALSPDVWGYRDTRFTIVPSGNAMLLGSRYDLSGDELPDLVPWLKRVLGVDFDVRDLHPPAYPPPIAAPVRNGEYLAAVRALLPADAIADDAGVRLRHGHGHTLGDMYAIKYRSLPRVPDLVVYPATEAEVEALVDAATRHDVCIVPYGGGTNVTEALRCPADERRMIVSIDLARMARVRWIDPVNHTACVEAGATGAEIQRQLAAHGFTMGHEPDSVELSTLGGWIATHASGMKKNRYGNIEDLVLDVHVVTPRGAITRDVVVPRESAGLDARRWMLGSEGTLGVITHAVVKVFPLPEVERYDALLFPSFDDGFAFLRDLARSGALPASVRLVDNAQFQLSQAIKPGATGLGAVRRQAERFFVTRVRGFDPATMVACTLVFEGSRAEVAQQRATVRRLMRRHGGMGAGAENGRKGYQLTFSIAYFRDFIMNHYIVGESFETSVSWRDARDLCERVKRRLVGEYAARGLPGLPFVSCRITQLYESGVAAYFYFGFYHKGVADPDQVYADLEWAARDEILAAGGSLSHHHGVGKLRQEFLPRVHSPAALGWARDIKRAVDPANIFGIGNR